MFLLAVAVAKCDLNERHDVWVVLLGSLELEEVVIRAPLGSRKFMANGGTRVIDAAFACFRIKKFARLPKDRIGFASQYALVVVESRKPLLSYFERNAKVFCQAVDIAFRDLNAIVD